MRSDYSSFQLHGKNGFAESTNLARYISENNFVRLNNYIGRSRWLLEYQNFLLVMLKRST